MKTYEPQHINACRADLEGNQGIGRYVFLTGSDSRAREISKRFKLDKVLKHPREHNLYLGTLSTEGADIDVASISTGMGGPSADIIINELIMLGARRLLRIGTAGSMQAERVCVGDLVVATAAVRDDKASWDYIYREYPAVASLPYVIAAGRAVEKLKSSTATHFGIVHSKSSLYAREFLLSLLPENEHYMTAMRQAGVIASEMECAQFFVLSSIMSEQLRKMSPENNTILSGCILAIVGDYTAFSSNIAKVNAGIEAAIKLGLETTQQLFLVDQHKRNLF